MMVILVMTTIILSTMMQEWFYVLNCLLVEMTLHGVSHYFHVHIFDVSLDTSWNISHNHVEGDTTSHYFPTIKPIFPMYPCATSNPRHNKMRICTHCKSWWLWYILITSIILSKWHRFGLISAYYGPCLTKIFYFIVNCFANYNLLWFYNHCQCDHHLH